MQADGPFAVTEIDPDGIHFRIDAPSWMRYRKGDGKFTVKAIRAIREHHPDAGATLKSAVDGNLDHDLDENEYHIEQIWARRRHKSKNSYEYKVVWRGHPLSEASYVPEEDIEGTLVQAFDEQTPRGSVSTDLPIDIRAYLKKFPGVLKTHSDTALESDSHLLAIRPLLGHLAVLALGVVESRRQVVKLGVLCRRAVQVEVGRQLAAVRRW